ncbi:GGDEF domain-containing protein [Motiliproteus coralliicola]|nr:GGDEF domain-containing protein [Motiliproteus coralliicola]
MDSIELLRAQAAVAGQDGNAEPDRFRCTSLGLRLLCLCGLLVLGGQAWGQSTVRVGQALGDPTLMMGAGGEPTGLSIEVLEAVARQQQWQLNIHRAAEAELLEQLDRGELDLLAGITRTPALESRYDFTRQSVYYSWAQLLTAAQLLAARDELAGRRVAAVKADPISRQWQRYLQQLGMQPQLLQAENYQQAISWVVDTKADAVLLPRRLVQPMLEQYPLHLTPLTCCTREIGYLARQGASPSKLDAIDAYLEQHRSDPDSDYQRGLQRLLGRAPSDNALGWLLPMLLVILLLAAGVTLRSQDRRRRAQLQHDFDEMEQRVQQRTLELSNTHTSLEQEVMHHRATQQQLRHLSRHDPLTGLPNRRYFSELMEQELKRAHRTGRPLVVMLLDLDGFKRINASLGYETGDQILVEIAARLGRTLREVDMLARQGGDEFVVMLSEISSAQDAPLVAQKMIDEIGQPLPQLVEVLGVHIGISYFPDHGYEVEQLLSKADRAMDCAKQRENSCYVDFDDL